MNAVGSRIRFGDEFLAEFRELKRSSGSASVSTETQGQKSPSGGASFLDQLKEGISEVDTIQKTADTMATNLATGKDANLHETMLAATQAELSFNLMVQVRNKVLEAYQEIMRMQV